MTHIACYKTRSTIWPSKPLSTYTKPSHPQPSCSLHTNTWLIATILNSATYIHLHTHIHGNTPVVGTLFFSLPLTTPRNGSWWYWQHDGTPQQAMKINTHPTTVEHTNVLPVTLVISESQFTFLMEVCFDPIIYFSMIYVIIFVFSISELVFRFLFSQKNSYCGCLVPTSFFCLLLVQEFWVDKCTSSKGFVQQAVSIVKGSLIMSRLFLFLIRSE